jgi:hypothetical protein
MRLSRRLVEAARVNLGFLSALLVVGSTVACGCTGSGGEDSSSGPDRSIRVVSDDPYTDPTTYHRTEVEPDSFAFGSTIVSAFQVGRHPGCGATNIGWSVSTDAGSTWIKGFLPGTTTHATPPGPWKRATDPVVAYDAKHDAWLVGGLAIPSSSCDSGWSVFVSRSTDGGRTFGEPVIVPAAKGLQLDPARMACDNSPTSSFYGSCHVSWDDPGDHNSLHMSISTDGGQTWTETVVSRDTNVFDGHPLVQPDGTVVIPILACCRAGLAAFVSTDGGRSYTGPEEDDPGPAFGETQVSQVAGKLGMNDGGRVISADVDAAGKVYVVWHDCRFRELDPNEPCSHNDIVMSTTTDGRHWTRGLRIPFDPRTSSVDHFLPAIGVDPSTAGTSAHIGIAYYFFPDAECDPETCELSVGFASSTDGGVTWTTRRLAGPIKTPWLAPRSDGYFVGDYISVSFVDGRAIVVFPIATEGECELGKRSCHEWIASATIPLPERA